MTKLRCFYAWQLIAVETLSKIVPFKTACANAVNANTFLVEINA